jgi:uncharacterized membrane protein
MKTMTANKPALPIAWTTVAFLMFAVVLGVGFVVGFALPYLSWNPEKFGAYWPKRGWLLLHIIGGIWGLLTGPFILWLGLKRQRMTLHRRLGKAYVVSMALSSLAALYLSMHTDLGLVFGMGLASLAVAWITTTSLALLSIRRRNIAQHQEWMIRSYVVTFGFVTFRIVVGILTAAGVGTIQERLSAASWFCWAAPLLITEAVLQGKKIRAVSTSLH